MAKKVISETFLPWMIPDIRTVRMSHESPMCKVSLSYYFAVVGETGVKL